MHSDNDLVERLTSEIANFEQITKYLIPTPGDLPTLQGIDIYGGTIPLNGIVGGDHLVYIDFKRRFDLEARIKQAAANERLQVVKNLQRCQRTAGIALMDVAGHRVTDALIAAMLHQAFLLGAIYELDTAGQVTRRLFENLNTRFYQSLAVDKFVSLIYGEISEDARFRFLSAAQPLPLVFSREHNRFMEVSQDLSISFPPLGMMPSLHVTDRPQTSVLGFKDHYQMNEWVILNHGDIFLLHTDGVAEHSNGAENYVPRRLEQTIRTVKHLAAADIFHAVVADMRAFGELTDDIGLVVIKRV